MGSVPWPVTTITPYIASVSHSDEKSNTENGAFAVQVCPRGLKAQAIGGKSNDEELGIVGQRSPTMPEAELSGHQLGVLETGMSTEMQTVKTGSF